MAAIKRADYPCNGPCLEHRAAPPHHPGGRPDILAYLLKDLLTVLRDLEDSLRMVLSVAFGIFNRQGKLESGIPKDMNERGVAKGLYRQIGRYSRVLSPREGKHDVLFRILCGSFLNEVMRLVNQIIQALVVRLNKGLYIRLKRSFGIAIPVLIELLNIPVG